MTDNNSKPGLFPSQGPISQQLGANSYLDDKNIPEILESLLAGLMLECPDDHITYLNRKLDLIKEIGTENITWDTFIVHLLRPQLQTILGSDLLHAWQDYGSFDHSSKSFVVYGSSQLFEWTESTVSEILNSDSGTNSSSDSETVSDEF